MFSDLKFIILWWLTVSGISLLSLPAITYLFKDFWDKGYAFTKIVALSLITYVVFVLSVFKLLPFEQYSILAVIMALCAAQYFVFQRIGYWPTFRKLIQNNYKIFLFEEIVFLVILTAWSYVRGFAPDIEGLEKFMDWGFVNSALRTKYLPPADMWFAGEPINYYYFGHLIFALLTKLSGISSAVTYNLSIALACALTFISTFSLSSNLAHLMLRLSSSAKKIKTSLFPVILAGLVSALLLTFGGNLHTIYKIGKINITQNGHLVLTPSAIEKAATVYWYPDATRFIGFDPDTKDKTIHEFPIYSFVVADLHGHMNDIAVVLFVVAFLLAMSVKKSDQTIINWSLVIPLGLALSVAYMTNAWDFAVYGLVFAITSFLITKSFWKTVINGLLTIVLWYLFTLPYNLNFIPMAQGLRLADAHSPFYQLFVLYGGFWLIALPFVIFFLRHLLTHKKLTTIDFFVFGLIITATILIILPELGYVKDIYIYEHRRANTMFKLVYQAFMIYAVCAGYILIRLRRVLPYKLLFALIFIIHLIYPYFAIKGYYGDLKNYKGLYGLNFLADRYPDNYQAILWIQKNISGQPVMLEAVGDSYTDYDQVSMSTGLPTVEGWIVHEWLWRGGYDKPAARQADVSQIYTGNDLNTVRSLLQKYSVSYIFVGAKEYEKYPLINEKNFAKLGNIVYQSGNTKIYKLNQ
ncbi:DUF2298 domain-containing protein [Patescibacteria group bacterium]|nr:DUF2298 domain-containing protein [Patescibacteria group bacterium]